MKSIFTLIGFLATVITSNGSPWDPCPFLVYLSETLVYCGETVEWIKMPLGTEVGLGPGEIVLGTQLPLTERGTAGPRHFSAHVHFGPCLLWPNSRPSQRLLSSC